ncbi:MAG: hypothetical protein AB9Q22_10285 [Candidatus Reddybacter sp.]
MAKSLADTILDAMLDLAEGDQVSVCAAQPTTYTEAITTNKLAIVTGMTAQYTKANGDTSGRKSTLAAQLAAPIDVTGTALHVAITNLGDTSLRRVTTCTSQGLTSGGTVDIGAHKHELQDVA